MDAGYFFYDISTWAHEPFMYRYCVSVIQPTACNNCCLYLWLVVTGQYREAATDLQHAVSLLRDIYRTQLVPFQHQKAASSIVGDHDDVDRIGVVEAVGSLIDTVALIGDELAERTQIERPSSTGQTNLSAGNVSAAVFVGPADGRRYSHADDLFQAAHIFHLCSIIILGVFVVEVRNYSSTIHQYIIELN